MKVFLTISLFLIKECFSGGESYGNSQISPSYTNFLSVDGNFVGSQVQRSTSFQSFSSTQFNSLSFHLSSSYNFNKTIISKKGEFEYKKYVKNTN